MTLTDFLNKYKGQIMRKEVAERLGITPNRLYMLEQGGQHNSMSKYAPLIEKMIPGCKDKIYIPDKIEGTPFYKKVEKMPFTDEEIELIKEKAYMLCYRTVNKILNGHMFSKFVHDKIMKQIRGEIQPIMNKKLIERYNKNENSQSISM